MVSLNHSRAPLAGIGCPGMGTNPSMGENTDIGLLEGDVFGYERLLDDDEQRTLGRVRAFLDASVAPIVDDHWMREEFPTR